MVEAPERRNPWPGPLGTSGPRAVTRSLRGRRRAVAGLAAKVLPPAVGGVAAVPVEAAGPPATGDTVLLVMSTGMSRMACSLLRKCSGQRKATSNDFSP